MSDNKWFPEGAQMSTAYLTVTKAEEAIEFYQKAFDLTVGESMPGPSGDLAHASMKVGDTHVVMFGPEGLPWSKSKAPKTSGNTSPVSMYLYVADVDAQSKQALEAGATLVEEAKDMFWGDRIAIVADPFGYEWTLATKVGEFDQAKLEEEMKSQQQ